MSDKIVWTQKPLISDVECILLCLKNAPCGTNKKQVDRLIKDYETNENQS
mgnify:FL=1|jgi:hypothetical protein